MKSKLKKFEVCNRCYSIPGREMNCVCSYEHDRYEIITLEFEVCKCCGRILNDGVPADTPFNDEQIRNHKFSN